MMMTAARTISGLRQFARFGRFQKILNLHVPQATAPNLPQVFKNSRLFVQLDGFATLPIPRHGRAISHSCGGMFFVFCKIRLPTEAPRRTQARRIPLIPDNRQQSGRFTDLTGFVLAGGASRRMGRAKESLRIDGESMLERQIGLLRSVARRVAVIGGPAGYLDEFGSIVSVPDAVPGRGPLGGIYTALVESRTEYNLILACDLPFVSRRLVTCLVRRAMGDGSDATVPRSRDGRLQPLCAVYRRRALYAVRTRLELGESKFSGFFSMVNCTTIPWPELADAGFRASAFDNMNRPGDYENARRRVELA